MRVTPVTEAEANAAGLWKRGIYDFEVVEAKERISEKGNDMIELKVKLFDTEGRSRTIFDYLVETEATAYKVRHFASATGMLPQYEKGELRAEDCEGKTGRCQVVIQADKKKLYPDKNAINDYVPIVPGAPIVSSMSTKELDDDIPF